MEVRRCPYCAEEVRPEAVKCPHCLSWLGGPGQGWLSRPLRRSTENRLIAGVCGGLAEYFGIDPTVMRVIYAAVTAFTAFLPGLILYVLLIFIIPPDRT